MTRIIRLLFIPLLITALGIFASGAGDKPATTKTSATLPTTLPDTHMRRPPGELQTIQLPPGYHLELVASDPDIISPSLITWDGNGRMYLAEMRTYMLDIRGSKAHTPASVVSRWDSTRGDGVYDKHTVFVDKMMLPRMILPLDDRILIRETDTKDIYSYRDTNNDGVADEKVRIYEGGKQEGNLEHQPSGLIWNLDNWIYVTHQDERFRFKNGKLEAGKLPIQPGQWGIAMDDTGRMIYATAGSERPAHNFQVNPQYGDIKLPGELVDGFTEVFPLALLTDFEGGEKRVRPGGGLNVFTACCGGSIFRGDALPSDLYGDYIVAEPAGRLIRRAKVTNVNGKTVFANAYDKKEFIASSDANFRPVFTATGPDGCLYIADMYRGIIQEANWTKEGSYLRPQIKKYGLDKNINGGRIWRVVHDNYPARREPPHMLDETPAQLVAHLSDPNGWWRDTAQKLLVVRGDKSVVPELKRIARTDTNPLARLHALWTLQGLDSVDNFLLAEKLRDEDPRLRAAAVRIAEPLMAKDPGVAALLRAAGNDSDPTVAAQVALSTIFAQPKDADALVDAVVIAGGRASGKDSFVRDVVMRTRENIAKAKEEEEKRKKMKAENPKLAEAYEKGMNSFSQTCIACHGAGGLGMQSPERNGTRLAPPLKDSKRLLADKLTAARIVLNGLTGPNAGKEYPGQMPSFRWADDEWLASILTFARNQWGNKAEQIDPADVAKIRSETAGRTKPFTVEELVALAPTTKPATRPATTTASSR